MDDRAYMHTLRLMPGVGSMTLKLLVNHFQSGQAALQASSDELEKVTGLSARARNGLIENRNAISVEEEWQKITSLDITVIAYNEKHFPKLLNEIPDGPALLYARGNYDFSASLSKPYFSIVGSRKFTDYGRAVVERIATDLSQAGFVLVSGLAFGIDSLSHNASLAADGETIAVLGGGVDDASISPSSHLKLAHTIMRSGAVISDYIPGTKPLPGTFPARNRIIAGLSLGTLVVEAAPDSGSLITARLALDYNREVFAVPGSIFSYASVGTNRLLRQGAKLVTCLDDILSELPRNSSENIIGKEGGKDVHTALLSLSPVEEKILKALTYDTLHIDKLIKVTTLEAAEITSTLSMLEIRGLVKNIGGMNYMRMQ